MISIWSLEFTFGAYKMPSGMSHRVTHMAPYDSYHMAYIIFKILSHYLASHNRSYQNEANFTQDDLLQYNYCVFIIGNDLELDLLISFESHATQQFIF